MNGCRRPAVRRAMRASAPAWRPPGRPARMRSPPRSRSISSAAAMWYGPSRTVGAPPRHCGAARMKRRSVTYGEGSTPSGTLPTKWSVLGSRLNYQVAMGAAFMAVRGFGAPEVHEAYVRAEALCDGLGGRADIFPALWGQWLFRWGRSEIDAAWRLGSRLFWRWRRIRQYRTEAPGPSCDVDDVVRARRIGTSADGAGGLQSTKQASIKPWRQATVITTRQPAGATS